MNIKLDEGFSFGLGAFETICVYHGVPILLDSHLERLNGALKMLGIDKTVNRSTLSSYLSKNPVSQGALKISVSRENTIIAVRENPYNDSDYTKGFSLVVSETLRNETSPLTYIKSLNYAENILEKRRAASLGYEEALFFNTRGALAEGSSTNIFLQKGNRLYTPALSCGLLNGTIRKYILERYPVQETCIYSAELAAYDEVFVTNSLLGIMPVTGITFRNGDATGSVKHPQSAERRDSEEYSLNYARRETAMEILDEYHAYIRR